MEIANVVSSRKKSQNEDSWTVMMRANPFPAAAVLIVVLMLTAATCEHAMGRKLWGISGTPGLWSGDIRTSHNSQFVADPYSFTHISHGVTFSGLLALGLRTMPVSVRLVMAVALESAWEILENSNTVIERYRKETISLNYFGDSIVNSMSDIVACMLGFALASKLPPRVTAAGTILLEIALALWIRDNLTLNIVMLLVPSRSIRAWQLRAH